MRLTAGKIYFWGGVTIAVLTTWNRYSTKQLRTVVDGMKEEKMREAERLRMYQQGGQGGGAPPQQVGDVHMPKHFNPYHKQQEMENEAASSEMPFSGSSLHNSRRPRQPQSYAVCDPFQRAPNTSARATGTGTITHVSHASSGVFNSASRAPLYGSSAAGKSARAGEAMSVAVAPPYTTRQGVVPTLPAMPDAGTGMQSSPAGAVGAGLPSGTSAATYTGSAILKTYTNRRKMLQKASALAGQMHRQVDDVVQMEEEQRLLSQAYRSRQKLAEQEQEQAQQKSRQTRQSAVKANPSLQSGSEGSPDQNGLISLLAAGEDGASNAGDLDGDSQNLSPTSAADGYGVVLEGAPDTKRMLQHQAHEKNEILGKMRGMQLAIQELSAEAVAEEERWYARPHFNSDAPPPAADDDDDDYLSAAEAAAAAAEVSKRHEVPPDVIGKLDAIRDLRMALKDMLDARRGHPADSGSYGGVDSGASGSTWVEQDASYNPPGPPQVFSTGALAVSLEYASDSVASLARISDEFCIATTFRARSDRLLLLPHLASLEKWAAQAERCLDTIRSHLRHFHIGETAVLEGGAYEVNSLREQTLMLKETLTAQDQKVKSTAETKAATLYRLREIHRRCRMWECHLLHRRTDTEADPRLLESPVFFSLGHARPNHSAASRESVRSSSSASRPHHPRDHHATTAATSTDYATTTTNPTATSTAATTPTTTALETGHSSAASPCSTFLAPASRRGSSVRAPRRQPKLSVAEGGDASSSSSPPPRNPTAILKDFLRISTPAEEAQVSRQRGGGGGGGAAAGATRHDGRPSPTAMNRMERRIARSWGNPYVRKRLLRQRVEAQQLQDQQQQQQQSAEDAEARQLLACSTSLSGPDVMSGEGGQQAAVPLARHSDRHLLVTPTAADDARVALRFPHNTQRGSPPQDHTPTSSGSPSTFPSTKAGGELWERQTNSRALESSAAGNSVSGRIGDAEMAELADARTLQLLQSLLRSVPVTSQRARNAPDVVDGTSTESDRSSESPLGVMDVTEDAAARDGCRQSIQRLLHFLETQMKPQNPKQPTASLT